ncbi:ABC transporter ATP-binding protein [Pikeienuella sp. HZG-20]|uniref:ABC transporter ATP-binding protein n=1 Tax=Paludibacillus litoralis TaxID=3133267 RepID=UPI0030EB574E
MTEILRSAPAPLLSVRNLVTEFRTGMGVVTAVDDVSFDVAKGERLAIVGESGSGKTITALSILQLIPRPPGRIRSGQVLLEGTDIMSLSRGALRGIRGGRIAMIFQEPMSSLNPVFTIGYQICEVLALHCGLRGARAQSRAAELLSLVNIPSPRQCLDRYPHELSGGMRQRAMIAMALAGEPQLLIADEPTTALDVTVQAQILDLLSDIQREFGMAIIFITHDLGVVAEFAERLIVMYAGKIVEEARVDRAFAEPLHPYTEGLIRSMPPIDRDVDFLPTIEGQVPPPHALPAGCRFNPRCVYARGRCAEQVPPLMELRPGQSAACIRHTDYSVPRDD